MIADFAAPVAPTGWLELDGSVISTVTYSGLFAVMSISSSGTRTNGSPSVTSIASTATFKAGYYIFGTGIAAGTTILSIDSSTSITMSGNASSSGTSSFFVSPWPMNTGTVTLPDFTTAGRYRRSRTSSTAVGQVQAGDVGGHTHNISGSTATEAAHTHGFSVTSGTESATHTHTVSGIQQVAGNNNNNGGGGGAFAAMASSTTSFGSTSESATHTHSVSGTTAAGSAHSHTISFTSAANSGTETRPVSMVVLTCIKT